MGDDPEARRHFDVRCFALRENYHRRDLRGRPSSPDDRAPAHLVRELGRSNRELDDFRLTSPRTTSKSRCATFAPRERWIVEDVGDALPPGSAQHLWW
ncbi:MAG: hypothetical protein IPN17_38500 [Deltaproteobacteria bacterium]|nr:hypothetical protein [Deltaproteobacteria bacterium]